MIPVPIPPHLDAILEDAETAGLAHFPRNLLYRWGGPVMDHLPEHCPFGDPCPCRLEIVHVTGAGTEARPWCVELL